MSNETVEIEDLILHFSTPKAYCVSLEEDTFGKDAKRIWLPKDQCEIDYNPVKNTVVLTMPEWLAIDKGLV